VADPLNDCHSLSLEGEGWGEGVSPLAVKLLVVG